MAVKKLDQSGLGSWVDGLIAKTRVFGVKASGDRCDFDRLASAAELRLDHDVTILPPKRFFQPQTEDGHYETTSVRVWRQVLRAIRSVGDDREVLGDIAKQLVIAGIPFRLVTVR